MCSLSLLHFFCGEAFGRTGWWIIGQGYEAGTTCGIVHGVLIVFVIGRLVLEVELGLLRLAFHISAGTANGGLGR